MTTIFIVWRYEFDSMENRDPISRSIVGYARDTAERDRALSHLRSTTETYEGRDGGWGGEKTQYPKFEVEEVKSLF